MVMLPNAQGTEGTKTVNVYIGYGILIKRHLKGITLLLGIVQGGGKLQLWLDFDGKLKFYLFQKTYINNRRLISVRKGK